jgi:hypothetical protein
MPPVLLPPVPVVLVDAPLLLVVELADTVVSVDALVAPVCSPPPHAVATATTGTAAKKMCLSRRAGMNS